MNRVLLVLLGTLLFALTSPGYAEEGGNKGGCKAETTATTAPTQQSRPLFPGTKIPYRTMIAGMGTPSGPGSQR